MSYYQQRGGDFATSPRGKVAENYAFILAKAAAGVPLPHIARMSGCSLADVRSAVDLPLAAPAPPPPPPVVVSLIDAPVKVRKGQLERALARRRAVAEERAARARAMPPKARQIVLEIAQRRGVDFDLVMSHRVFREPARARQEAYHTLYMTGNYSLPLIGSWFGGLDHTSVMYGIRMHRQRMQADLDAWTALGATEAA